MQIITTFEYKKRKFSVLEDNGRVELREHLFDLDITTDYRIPAYYDRELLTETIEQLVKIILTKDISNV